ncbi:MAG: 1-acyl-sn-glycerol-3-phosphate acyltransferase [Verrucomicrobiae bacterium]|nr:1-acyl-sn-glycerol-3-phosphate acyltransferase [Verrucomicrobiae bacterium]NNJ85822.1 1-acyl-sn-glycerol-3-phosphate acyltransferase [Akkermansiaceae bacterium]
MSTTQNEGQSTSEEAQANNELYPRWLSYCVFIPAAIFTLTSWIAGALLLFVASLVTHPFLNKTRHARLGNQFLGNLFVFFFKVLSWLRVVKIDDKELDPYIDMEGPLIIASNHPALWDAPLLIQRFIYVSCIMKKELLNNPILRSGARFSGFVPNLPTLTMVRQSTEHLNQKGRLLLFPEGTRTRPENAPCNPFRHGVALLAKNTQCPILPVFIFMNSRYMQKGWPIWKMPPCPIRVKIKVGEIQKFRENEGTHDFSDRLQAYFGNFVETMDPWKSSSDKSEPEAK